MHGDRSSPSPLNTTIVWGGFPIRTEVIGSLILLSGCPSTVLIGHHTPGICSLSKQSPRSSIKSALGLSFYRGHFICVCPLYMFVSSFPRIFLQPLILEKDFLKISKGSFISFRVLFLCIVTSFIICKPNYL